VITQCNHRLVSTTKSKTCAPVVQCRASESVKQPKSLR
jgi:hypothetical protein